MSGVVWVFGDVVQTTIIATKPGEEEKQEIRNIATSLGGAVHIGRILQQLDNTVFFIHENGLSQEVPSPTLESYARFESTLILDGAVATQSPLNDLIHFHEQFVQNKKEQSLKEKAEVTDDWYATSLTKAWRLKENLGQGQSKATKTPRVDGRTIAAKEAAPSVIVIDDAGTEVVTARSLKEVRALVPDKIRPHLVYRAGNRSLLGRGLDAGDWDYLSTWTNKRLLITRADYWRQSGFMIRKGLSWEQSAADVALALRDAEEHPFLKQFDHIVILFAYDGLVICSRDKDQRKITLMFDPRSQEGQWERQFIGSLQGRRATVAAAFAAEMTEDSPKVENAALSALGAVRHLGLIGFADVEPTADKARYLDLPYPELADVIRTRTALTYAKKAFADCDVPSVPAEEHMREWESWTIMQTTREHQKRDARHALPMKIVVSGVEKALTKMPVVRMGDLLLFNRKEIEEYAGARDAIDDYLRGNAKLPLAYAVFGPPGAGKSYGLKQLAKTKSAMRVLRYDLSQFRGDHELVAAFHTVRDSSLEGSVPLVLWDEFDCSVKGEDLYWLRNFLGVLQDGKFRDGQLEHPIGRGVFVFLGGTCKTFAAFSEDAYAAEDSDAYKAASLKKLPDFVSRLKGHIDVIGINVADTAEACEQADVPREIVIRRAGILRDLLERNCRHLIVDGKARIAPDVAKALLFIRFYKHGVRSLEALLLSCRVWGEDELTASCLPHREQMEVHVNVEKFMELVRSVE